MEILTSKFEIQVVTDLWRYYIYEYYGFGEDVFEECHPEMIGHFREWLDEKEIIAFEKYLPQSDSDLAEIVKYCVENAE